MVRLYLFAEGLTEQTYADTVLKQHMAPHGVYLQPPVCIAHARKKGRIHRGGGRRYQPMKDDIVRFLRQEKGKDVFFTTMIDLYALAPDFPGLEETDKLRHKPRERVQSLEKAFAGDIPDARFIPHLQLHEFETILFCDPTVFRYEYDECEPQIAALQAIVDQLNDPELIDDGPETAPSKRILQQFPDYAKATTGPQLAEVIELTIIRARCSHFHAWVTRLEQCRPIGSAS